MNKDLAVILAKKIKDIPEISTLTGMVEVLTHVETTAQGTFTKNYPIATDIITYLRNKTPEIKVIPDHKEHVMIYFEDNGTTIQESNGNRQVCTSNLRLVCWINGDKVKPQFQRTYRSNLIQKILALTTNTNPINIDNYSRMKIKANRIVERSENIFGQYSYGSNVPKLIAPPNNYFAIDYTITYNLVQNCMNLYHETIIDKC